MGILNKYFPSYANELYLAYSVLVVDQGIILVNWKISSEMLMSLLYASMLSIIFVLLLFISFFIFSKTFSI